MKRVYLTLMIFLGLTGCSVYEDGFKCPIGEGESCKSLSFVDNKVDQGAYSDSEEEKRSQRHQSMVLFYPETRQRMDLKIPGSK